MRLTPREWDGNVLGRTLDRFVVIADGHFWFETSDLDLLERGIRRTINVKANPVHLDRQPGSEQLGDLEIWVRRERGSELFHRDGLRARRNADYRRHAA